MDSNYAIVENGLVTNVIVWDGASEWEPPAGTTLIPLSNTDRVGPGYSYNGSTFTPPISPPNDPIDNIDAPTLTQVLIDQNVITAQDVTTDPNV